MIHFTCDGCGRLIDDDHEQRYVLRVEIYEAPDVEIDADREAEPDPFADSAEGGGDAERDHLAELEDLIERDDDHGCEPRGERLGDDYQQQRFDLCMDCRRRLASDPLGRFATSKIEFSDN